MSHTKHIPVLLEEVLEKLCLQPGNLVVDGTFGGGGHARKMLLAVGTGGLVVGIDQDQSALARFSEQNTIPKNLRLVHANYSAIEKVVAEVGMGKADAILADFGFSSDQIEEPDRGLSFLHEGPLDMRLDQSQEVTAGFLVNTKDEAWLRDIFWRLGDEAFSGKIAKAIAAKRQEAPLATTKELADLVAEVIPKARQTPGRPRPQQGSVSGRHPATKVFQALRIAVNQEYEHIVRFLEGAVNTLGPGGRLAIITFHSGEDTLVKKFFVEKAKSCVCPKEFPVCRCSTRASLRVLTKKGIRPSEEEVQNNPRARSAILRVAEKI
jgi:16S rRNA (cytosine1402-N4)-methyltransferase